MDHRFPNRRSPDTRDLARELAELAATFLQDLTQGILQNDGPQQAAGSSAGAAAHRTRSPSSGTNSKRARSPSLQHYGYARRRYSPSPEYRHEYGPQHRGGRHEERGHERDLRARHPSPRHSPKRGPPAELQPTAKKTTTPHFDPKSLLNAPLTANFKTQAPPNVATALKDRCGHPGHDDFDAATAAKCTAAYTKSEVACMRRTLKKVSDMPRTAALRKLDAFGVWYNIQIETYYEVMTSTVLVKRGKRDELPFNDDELTLDTLPAKINEDKEMPPAPPAAITTMTQAPPDFVSAYLGILSPSSNDEFDIPNSWTNGPTQYAPRTTRSIHEPYNFDIRNLTFSHVATYFSAHGIATASDDLLALESYARSHRNRVATNTNPTNQSFKSWPHDVTYVAIVDPKSIIKWAELDHGTLRLGLFSAYSRRLGSSHLCPGTSVPELMDLDKVPNDEKLDYD
ncbi:hypothetical protein DFH06DRAFT_1149923 [Mycena polygramma]|nr:hypothetical protein DFH06DRAFT_1149923 [Mycena polygramma]